MCTWVWQLELKVRHLLYASSISTLSFECIIEPKIYWFDCSGYLANPGDPTVSASQKNCQGRCAPYYICLLLFLTRVGRSYWGANACVASKHIEDWVTSQSLWYVQWPQHIIYSCWFRGHKWSSHFISTSEWTHCYAKHRSCFDCKVCTHFALGWNLFTLETKLALSFCILDICFKMLTTIFSQTTL